jgi:hypothetical protein
MIFRLLNLLNGVIGLEYDCLMICIQIDSITNKDKVCCLPQPRT